MERQEVSLPLHRSQCQQSQEQGAEATGTKVLHLCEA